MYVYNNNNNNNNIRLAKAWMKEKAWLVESFTQ